MDFKNSIKNNMNNANRSSLLNSFNNGKENESVMEMKGVELEFFSKEDVKQLFKFQKGEDNQYGMPPLTGLSIKHGGAIEQILRQQFARDILNETNTISSLEIDIPGYGVFQQNKLMASIVQLVKLVIEANTDKQICRIKTLIFNFPGWMGIEENTVNKLCEYITMCKFLQHLSLHFGNWMNTQGKQDQLQIKYYGKNTFTDQNFKNIMKIIKSGNSLQRLELRFPNWRKIHSEHIKIFNEALQTQKENEHLRYLTFELSGWGYKNKDIKQEYLKDLRAILEDFNKLQEIHIDLRNWDDHYQLGPSFKSKLKIDPSRFMANHSQVSKLFKSSKSKRLSVFGKSEIKNNNAQLSFKLVVLI